MSLLSRLVVLVLVAMLPALAIQALNEFRLRSEGLARTHSEALRQAELLAAEQARLIDGVRRTLLLLAETRALRQRDGAACQRLLEAAAGKDPYLRHVSVVDPQGRVFCSGEGPVEPPPSGVHFDAMRRGGFVVGRYGLDHDAPVIRFAQAVRGFDGAIAGAVIAAVDVQLLVAGVGALGWSENTTTLIADRDGVVLARYPEVPGVVGTSVSAQYPGLFFAPIAGVREEVAIDGVERIIGFVPPAVGPGGLFVGVGIAKAAALASVDAATWRGVAVILAGAAIALLLAVLGGRYFLLVPLDRLATGLRRLGAGDLSARTGLGGARGELGELGAAFDRVAARLESAMAELREARDRAELGRQQLAVALTASHAYGWSWDLESGAIERSENAAELLGVSPEALASAPATAASLLHVEQSFSAMERFRAELLEKDAAEVIVRMPDRRGEQSWLLTRARVSVTAKGRRVAHGVTMDVSERQQLMLQKDLLLREVNHRVMNGLAMISSVLTLQRARIADPAEAERFDAAVRRVSSLAAVYRRLHARQEMHEVELASYLRELCGDLLASVAEEDRIELEVTAERPVRAPADRVGALGVAIAELLTNAVKYAFPDGRRGRIEIRIEAGGPEGGRIVFRDDGIGLADGEGRAGGLGTLLVRGLAGQIGGEVTIEGRGEGVKAVFRFPWLGA